MIIMKKFHAMVLPYAEDVAGALNREVANGREVENVQIIDQKEAYFLYYETYSKAEQEKDQNLSLDLRTL